MDVRARVHAHMCVRCMRVSFVPGGVLGLSLLLLYLSLSQVVGMRESGGEFYF